MFEITAYKYFVYVKDIMVCSAQEFGIILSILS